MERIWWKEAVAYQIYLRSFYDSNGDGIGDIPGIIEKLDYLKDLGIDVIWVCPFYKSPNADNGYDISDYQAVLEEFGTMDDFDRLLEEAHKRDMKLIIDLVVNHTSDEHPWFIESRSSKDHPKRDWYIWADQPNNWQSIFGGPAWQYDKHSDQYYLHIFSVKQPDLNWENKDMRQSIYDMINWWLDKGIDGFRVDAISHIKKTKGLPNGQSSTEPPWEHMMNVDGIHNYLDELYDKTFSNYDIMTVGEANGVSTDDIYKWVGKDEGKFSMIFQFEHLDLWDRNSNAGVDVPKLKEVLTKWQHALDEDGWNALFIENHDIPRATTTWGNDEDYWYECATALGVMYFFMKGTPFIYQGQEIGMKNAEFSSINDFNDIKDHNFYKQQSEQGESAQAIIDTLNVTSRDHSRTPMQWSAEPNAGFTTGTPWLKTNPNYKTINVESQLNDPNSVLSFYKDMIQLKKSNETFTYGKYDLVFESSPTVFAYTRTLNEDQVLVLTNLSEDRTPIDLSQYELGHLLLNNYSEVDETVLKPYEARVYQVK
ncbi:glycoside hydrolase family 13 protein [Alkalibacillus haloalkaliphilus]|uniref:Alpha-glucosidase n=1 Tax=Alkalibacillus haloalkaliphilus TaxID=94136 RepID=A0A511W0K3_9BACI|nr:alpha-glucosidase [Alkalibacillus haloalkaliphilus]GEN44595.1 alpha-glucosidase [Alkalibacillus haloalkaliphilus]